MIGSTLSITSLLQNVGSFDDGVLSYFNAKYNLALLQHQHTNDIPSSVSV
jgi:hypothetical protein